MKKILPLLLVAVMFLTSIPIVYAEDTDTYKVGDIIQFGSYPQSEVKDEALIAELNALAPEWEDWTSYGYYSGDSGEGSMAQGDWMRYFDVVHGENKYRGVMFTEYRYQSTYYDESALFKNIFQSVNGYFIDTVYWFVFEPIDWRLLDPNTGFMISETIIDSQPYNNTIYVKNGEYYNDDLCENYANDYSTSSIRKWLGTSFYNTAFSEREKNEICMTTLNNDGLFTLNGVPDYEEFDGIPTEDKIYLPSFDEVINSKYGFSPTIDDKDATRVAQGSDYARSQGLHVYTDSHVGNSSWRLRTSSPYSNYSCTVSGDGSVDNYKSSFLFLTTRVNLTNFGIRPALRLHSINNSSHTHSHNAVGTKPTCTAQGYTTYTCECGDSYIDDYVDASGHSFTNYISDGKATCVVDGLLIAKCDNCDKTDSIHEKGDHKFSDSFTIDTDPTCTNEGTKSRHCVNCTEKTDVTSIGKLAHTYNMTTINPTCTDKGYNVYTCNCSDSYTETIEATGHSYEGSVCTTCGHDRADECDCACHASGIKAFFFKIKLFFWKLFKKNPLCECGAAHY